MRGEQLNLNIKIIAKKGSPPLARGTAANNKINTWPFGITPACAGNSEFADDVVFIAGDHPRLRGEQGLEENG